jgi:hypothetical protein
MSTLRVEDAPQSQPPSAPSDRHPSPAKPNSLCLDPTERSARRGLLVLDALFLTISITLVYLVPGGGWRNSTMGVWLWWNGDPGVGYLVGSLYVFTPARHTFVGHPGLPIEIIVGVFAKLIHLSYRLGGGHETIYQFWAHHMRGLFILGGVLISIIHVISFHVVYALAKRLVNDPKAALLAVVAYASSFPVLHYSTRVSPEPLLVIAFALTIIALWNVQARLDEQNRRAACWWAALAGFTSVTAIYIKFHLAMALPLIACLQLLLQNGAQPQSLWQRMRSRIRQLGIFVLCATATVLIGMLKVDWPWFLQWWQRFAPGQHHARGTAEAPLGGPIRGFLITTRDNLIKFLPQMTLEGIFPIIEGAFVITALVALIWYWRTYRNKRSLIFWPLLYCALITPVFIFRGLWHYVFLQLAVGAAPLALMIWHLSGKFLSRRPRFAAALGVVLLLHSLSFIFFANSRIYDLRRYRKFVQAYHIALDRIKTGERVAVIAPDGIPPRLLYGYWPDWISNGDEFKDALDDMIVQVGSPQKLTDQFIKENQITMVVARKGLMTRAWPVKKFKSIPAFRSEREPKEAQDMPEDRRD